MPESPSPARMSRSLARKAQAISLQLMDVDGVLTEGRIY